MHKKPARQRALATALSTLTVLLISIALAGCAGTPVKVYAPDGIKRQVFEWGFWNGRCQPSEFTIKISKGPQSGKAELGVGSMTISEFSATGARMACEGRTVATKVVYYTANKGFRGSDTFLLTVYSNNSAPRLFDVEVSVN